jgi:7,8-dihydropterin-6-yl-methyl-4-(beta-D-ribofuranosyl)aminobenzene 5'-phosphate synthase
MRNQRHSYLLRSAVTCLAFMACSDSALGQEKDFNAYPDHVSRYLKRSYDQQGRQLEYRDDYPGGFEKWQDDARSALRLKIGLDKIAASVGDHEPVVELDQPVDLGDYTRQRGVIETEPDVRIPFWLLKPKAEGKRQLGVFPHGHDRRGPETTAGVYTDEAHERKSLAEDRDVAVQAVKHGFVAIAPAVRGLATDGVPDLHGRHGKRDCRSHLMHCLLAGHTATGERVWDMQRILDWAFMLPEVDSRHTLMMGNSGGGMVTMFTAACDERIDIAVPSCSFAPTVSEAGYIFHCDCNMVPGLIDLGGLPGVCGLIAPRHLLAVNGRKDTLFSTAGVEQGAATVRSLYMAAGCPERFERRWGAEGHRFYKDLMWTFVLGAMQSEEGKTASMTIRVIYDNYPQNNALQTDWGFACLVTGPEKTVLFDTGGKGDLLLDNLRKMAVRPRDVDLIVISHNHGDHTGGLLPYLKENPDSSVFLPAKTPEGFVENVQQLASEVTVVSKPTEICDGAVVLGPMGEKIIEQALVLDTKKGLVIVTGCSHPGIVAIAKKAKEELDQDIYMILGGTHLLRHSDDDLKAVIDDLKKLGVQKVAATHCSGDRAISMLRDAFGDGFVKMGVGRVIDIDAE